MSFGKGDGNMKKAAILLIFTIIVILTACSTGDNDSSQANEQNSEKSAEVPEVEVEFEQDPLPTGKKTTIKALVTQGGEPVPDAEYVKFEIWKSDEEQETSQTIEAEHVEKGMYEIKHTFKKAGTYEVIAHTQVDSLHTMPQVQVDVGKAQEPSEHGHTEASGKFMVHFMTEEPFKAGKESNLTVHINHMEEPFTDGLVKFEISSEELETPIFINAEEKELGEYTTAHTFKEPGTYTINIHYEKPEEEIHEHMHQEIVVK